MVKSHKGEFKPKHPEKYVGRNNSKIEYKSGLELRFMMYCDDNPHIIKWSYEGIIIPYMDPTTDRIRRYFVDFWIQKKNVDGTKNAVLIEIKPKIQTKPPEVKPGKSKRTLINEAATWAINTNKWAAAEMYCQERNWKFLILTEEQISGLKQ